LQVQIKNKCGLHARPAGQLVKVAQEYDSELKIRYQEKEANAKSILDVLMLAAESGCDLEISARGRDASKALSSIWDFFQKEM